MLWFSNLPPEQLPFSKKGKVWRQQHVQWADKRSYFYNNTVRKSLTNKRINYNLIDGILDINDMLAIINPDMIDAGFIPENIQHYPIINSKLNLIRGEEWKRPFEPRVIISNPNTISEIDEQKRNELLIRYQELIQDTSLSEEQLQKKLKELEAYYRYTYRDLREIRANYLLKHYMAELKIPVKFNAGIVDACICGEEMYQCDIVGGEPTFERLNPRKVHVFRNGYSNKIEDADIIIIDDFWSPGRIIDTFYDVLTPKDIKYIDQIPQSSSNEMSNYDERDSFVNINDVNSTPINEFALFMDPINSSFTNYYDNNGNIRVLRMYWKSKRAIKKVKFFDKITGEAIYDFFPETYKVNKELGEEEKIMWINEAWEGTKIGKELFVNMRPRVIQYNRMSNPSRCHFGIVGSIYNINDSKPYSYVDMMKPYNYLYDAIHDRLNKAIAANWGKIVKLDLAQVPKGWEIDKWMYYAKIHKIAVTDSFKEGNKGLSTGKLAGTMPQQASGVIDGETGNSIQQYINLLEFIKLEMAEITGITKQREGQISQRETVGGVERSVLSSSNITEWIYTIHNDTKHRALECFIETAKIAMKGKKIKFNYILSDHSTVMVDMDGDEFAESDYGIVSDGTAYTQELAAKLDQLAHAALQNQTLSFSTIMKIYTNSSLADIQRTIEKDETERQDAIQQQAEAERQLAEQESAMEMEMEQYKLDQDDIKNIRDNQTKLLVAEMNSESSDIKSEIDIASKKQELLEKMRQFDEELEFKREELKAKKEIAKMSKNKPTTK